MAEQLILVNVRVLERQELLIVWFTEGNLCGAANIACYNATTNKVADIYDCGGCDILSD